MLNTIEEAIEDFRNGKFLIVVDDEDRENEGDFVIAAEKITPEKVNFMLHEGRGVLCAPLPIRRCHELNLTRQTAENTSILGTPFTIMVDNTRHIKYVSGHKTAKKDSAWICKLLSAGLLKESFVPRSDHRDLRDLTR